MLVDVTCVVAEHSWKNPDDTHMPEAEGDIPAWDGQPATLEDYMIEAHWHRARLNKADRVLAVARLRSRLGGPAKKCVRRLNAEEYEVEDGLERLLAC